MWPPSPASLGWRRSIAAPASAARRVATEPPNRRPADLEPLEVHQPLQRGVKAQAAAAGQRRAIHLGLLIGVGSRKAAVDLPVPKHWLNGGIGELGVLAGGKLSLPGSILGRVGADRPEIWTAADQMSVA